MTLVFYAPNETAFFWTVRIRHAPTLLHATEAAQHCLHVIGSDLRVSAIESAADNDDDDKDEEPPQRPLLFFCCCWQQQARTSTTTIVRIHTRHGPRRTQPLPPASLARAAAFIGGLTPQRLQLYAQMWRTDEAPCTRARARRRGSQGAVRHLAP